jgi:DNA-binding transcriptional MerR regulator
MLLGRSYAIAELEKHADCERRTIVYYIQQGLLPRVGRRGPNTRYPEDTLRRLQLIRGIRDLQDTGQLLSASLGEIRRLLAGLTPDAVRDLLDRRLPAGEIAALLASPPPELPPAAPPAALALAGSAQGMPVAPAHEAIAGQVGGQATDEAPDQTTEKVAGQSPAQPTGHNRPPPRPSADGRRYGLADASIRYRPPAASGGAPPGTAADPSAAAARPALPPAKAPSMPSEDADLGELLRKLEEQVTLNRQRVPPGGAEHWTEIPLTSRLYLSVRGLAETDAPLADAAGRALKRMLRES